MTFRYFIAASTIGIAGASAFVGIMWLLLDAYTRIAYASLGLPYPG